MIFALILPAMLLGYLSGATALIMGFGWLASLGIVMAIGTLTVLGLVALALIADSHLRACPPTHTARPTLS